MATKKKKSPKDMAPSAAHSATTTTETTKTPSHKISPLEFPCEFQIKAMGYNNESFEKNVLTIVRKYAPDLKKTALKTRPSKGDKYLSITITINATSKAQLDHIYLDLNACKDVVMTL